MPVGQKQTNVSLALVMCQSEVERGSAQRLYIFKRFKAQISQEEGLVLLNSLMSFLFCVFWPLRELMVN